MKHDLTLQTDLFHFCEVVFGVAVEDEFAHRDEWVLGVQPDFGDVEGVVGARGGLLGGHALDVEGVGRVVPGGDGIVEVPDEVVGIFACDSSGVTGEKVANTLVGSGTCNSRMNQNR